MTELIKQNSSDYISRDSDLSTIDHSNEERIRELLLGHKITKIADDHMQLDDGTVVKVVGNGPHCACDAGVYELNDLNEIDNIITNVTFEHEGGDEYEDQTYRVFVVAEEKYQELFSVTGNDGNGYYGTGYQLLVRRDV